MIRIKSTLVLAVCERHGLITAILDIAITSLRRAIALQVAFVPIQSDAIGIHKRNLKEVAVGVDRR